MVRGVQARKSEKAVRMVALLGLGAALTLGGCGVDLDAPIGGEAANPTFTPIVRPTATPAPATATVANETPTPVPSDIEDPTRYSVQVEVDASERNPISPLIYGVADPTGGNDETHRWLGTTLARWGGNARTRHNWEINASNAGSDYEYANVPQGDDTPGSASVAFMERNSRLGMAGILTIPNIGWVAKDKSSRSQGVPAQGGPRVSEGSDAAYTQFRLEKWTAPYDPAANRAATSVQALPSKGAPFSYPPDLNDGKVYQDEWVAYLAGQRKADAQPPIYAMDNEPDLWADSTHVDVHPVRTGYADVLSTFQTYARAVKSADPEGLVAGPESWGVTGYLYSALDEGGDKFGATADRKANGNEPFLQWFVRSVARSDEESGNRTLDVLTVHYYPNQGEFTGGNEPQMQDKRMQAPRALWDGLYVEKSWVADTEWANLALLPRLRNMVGRFYPGTKFGLTEWNFGGEDDISGAIATADTLGILGREQAYVAAYWGLPKQGSPTGWAFRLYSNYDGKGSSFGSESVLLESESNNMFSGYGALAADGSRLNLVLINKDRARTADISVQLKEFTASESATRYVYSQADLTRLVETATQLADPANLKVELAPMSITLVALERKK